jgi:hypothetical protein
MFSFGVSIMSALNPIINRVVGKFVKEDWLDFMFSHVDSMLTVKRVLARVVSIQDETPDIKRFVLQPNNIGGFSSGSICVG